MKEKVYIEGNNLLHENKWYSDLDTVFFLFPLEHPVYRVTAGVNFYLSIT